ncbi:hypothetical protein IPdc08_01809 [archaeon]|nr:hypothetical protein IPdc08_01809 [archaeon]
MKLENSIKITSNGCLLEIIVQPGVRRNELSGFNSWRGRIEIKIKVEAKDNKANKELEEYLSDIFDCRVEIVNGKKSRQKTVFIPREKSRIIDILSKGLTSQK